MARDRGAFPIHSHQKEQGHEFLERIWDTDDEIRRMSEKYGRRNIALTTTAPAGSVSVLTQTTSGIEPAYLLKYTRRKKINQEADPHAQVDFVDDVGDSWQEYEVYHHGYKKWLDKYSNTVAKGIEASGTSVDEEGLIAMSPYWKSTSGDIDWIAKVRMQAAAQRWICHAISNTTNVPKDTDKATVAEIYMEGWRAGCKGVTVYRDGSRSGVLVESRENEGIRYHSSPKRPLTLPCDIHHATIKGEKWTILVGLLDGQPYEIIGGLAEFVEIPKKYNVGTIAKRPRKTRNSIYDLSFGENGNEVTIKDVVRVFDNPNHAGFTRIMSLALRHGAPRQYIVEQLQKDKDADLFSFARVTARVLKKYIKDGTVPGKTTCENCSSEDTLIYQEGCVTCTACGFGKCG